MRCQAGSLGLVLAVLTLTPLLAGCCGQPIKRQALGTVKLSDVLNQARTEFNGLKRYSVSIPAQGGQCPIRLQVDDYVLTVSLKTTGTHEVKTTGSLGPTTGTIQWTIGPEFDDSTAGTASTAITWQSKPIKEELPPRGTWVSVKDKPSEGTWRTAVSAADMNPTGIEQFDDSNASGIKTVVQPGESITADKLPTLNDLVREALHEMIAASRPQPCVYPTGLEFHAGFEVISATSLDNKVAIVFITATNQVTSKMDTVQDLDLKMNLKPGAITLR